MMYLSVKDRLISELGKSFDPKINFDKRIRVLSDLLIFKPGEDKSVWKQKTGELPEYFTVYFDEEYICGFNANDSIGYATLEFWKGFRQAYIDGKIHLDPNYKEPEVKAPAKKKRKATTPEEKMAEEVVKRLTK